MSINILSQDGNTLINYNNVASLYIKKEYMQYSHPSTWWEIIAMYSSASSGTALYNVIARFENEQNCKSVFRRMLNLICEQKENFISINELIKQEF